MSQRFFLRWHLLQELSARAAGSGIINMKSEMKSSGEDKAHRANSAPDLSHLISRFDFASFHVKLKPSLCQGSNMKLETKPQALPQTTIRLSEMSVNAQEAGYRSRRGRYRVWGKHCAYGLRRYSTSQRSGYDLVPRQIFFKGVHDYRKTLKGVSNL